jgi:hypothetical protein
METTKTITRKLAVLDRDFTYAYYTTNTFKAGETFRIGGPTGYRLCKDGIVVVLGHGATEVIPNDHFHFEVEEKVHTIATTRRRAV